jgi:hypothetical protein
MHHALVENLMTTEPRQLRDKNFAEYGKIWSEGTANDKRYDELEGYIWEMPLDALQPLQTRVLTEWETFPEEEKEKLLGMVSFDEILRRAPQQLSEERKSNGQLTIHQLWIRWALVELLYYMGWNLKE